MSKMVPCIAITRKGKGHPCPNNAPAGPMPLCHVHDPNALFQRQVAERHAERDGGEQLLLV